MNALFRTVAQTVSNILWPPEPSIEERLRIQYSHIEAVVPYYNHITSTTDLSLNQSIGRLTAATYGIWARCQAIDFKFKNLPRIFFSVILPYRSDDLQLQQVWNRIFQELSSGQPLLQTYLERELKRLLLPRFEISATEMEEIIRLKNLYDDSKRELALQITPTLHGANDLEDTTPTLEITTWRNYLNTSYYTPMALPLSDGSFLCAHPDWLLSGYSPLGLNYLWGGELKIECFDQVHHTVSAVPIPQRLFAAPELTNLYQEIDTVLKGLAVESTLYLREFIENRQQNTL